MVTFYDIASVGNFALVPISILPLVLNWKYYRQTRISDYALIATYFFFWSIIQSITFYVDGFQVSQLSIFVDPVTLSPLAYNIYYRLSWTIFNLDAIVLAIVAIRAKWGSLSKMPLGFKIFFVVPLAVHLFYLFDFDYTCIWVANHPNEALACSRGFALHAGRLIYHFFVIYCFVTVAVNRTRRTDITRLLWILSSLGWFIAHIPFLILSLTVENWFYFPEYSGWLLFFFYSLNIGAFLLLINHIVFPESVLFTHEQIIKAKKLHANFVMLGTPLLDVGMGQINNYLENIPEELLKALDLLGLE